MQFPVGVALRELANFAAGQVTMQGQKKSSPNFRILLFAGAKLTFMLVSSKYVFRKAKRAILGPLWQNTEREIRSGRKGRGEWSICRQWFSTFSVYHMIVELILWCHGAAHSGSSGRMRLLHIIHTTLIIWLLREMEVRLPVTVHMCRRATECPSHLLRMSQKVWHVGQRTVLPCFCEGFPSTLHVAFGTWVSELKKSLRERTRSSIQVQSADLWMTSLSEMLDVVITLEYISKERQTKSCWLKIRSWPHISPRPTLLLVLCALFTGAGNSGVMKMWIKYSEEWMKHEEMREFVRFNILGNTAFQSWWKRSTLLPHVLIQNRAGAAGCKAVAYSMETGNRGNDYKNIRGSY